MGSKGPRPTCSARLDTIFILYVVTTNPKESGLRVD
jgi:hypothetical protein